MATFDPLRRSSSSVSGFAVANDLRREHLFAAENRVRSRNMMNLMIRAIETSRFAAAFGCVLLVGSPIVASNMSPGIHGTVFEDLNQDGQIAPDEVLSGISMELFRDNGDGFFNPSNDTVVGGPITTNAFGNYSFSGLNGNDSFFVRQLATPQYQAAVSPLIRPGDADLFVDDFSTGADVNANNVQTSDLDAGIYNPSTPTLGGTRELVAELISGAGDVRVLINPYGRDDRLIYSTSAGVTGRSRLTWDFTTGAGTGNSVPNLSPIDLTDGGRLQGVMVRAGIDQSGTSDLMTVRLIGDNATSDAEVFIPTTDGFDTDFIFVPFSDFVGSVDPAATLGVELLFGSGAPSVDASIELVGLLGAKVRNFSAAPVSVPEPSSSVLMVTALFIVVRRLRRGDGRG